VARTTPSLPSAIEGKGSFSRAAANPSPWMGEGREGVIVRHEHAHHTPVARYQVTSATTPISIAKA